MEPAKTPSQTARNLRYSSFDAVNATPWSLMVLPGSFLAAGFLNALFEVGPFWFGLIAAMPAIANALQVVLVPVTARFLNVRDLTLSMGWLNTGLWISGVVGMAFLPLQDPQNAGIFFTILYFLSSISMSMMVVGWMTWVTEFIPRRIRGRYMGYRNRLASISTVIFILLSMTVLGLTNASRWSYVFLCGLAALMRGISMMVQHLIVTPRAEAGQWGGSNWTRDIFLLLKDRTLLRFIIFGALAGFWLANLGTIGPLYALNELAITPAKFTSFALVATIAGALFVRIWGELIDRHGAIPVIIICFGCWRAMDFGWLLLTPDNTWIMYILWTWGGVMGTGYLVATFTLLLKLVPNNSRAAGISLNLTATSITAGLAPILVGFFIQFAASRGWDMIFAYRSLFGLFNAGGILTLLLLLKMPEPNTTADRNNIAGAMRTLRYLTVNQGATFLSNATFVVRRK